MAKAKRATTSKTARPTKPAKPAAKPVATPPPLPPPRSKPSAPRLGDDMAGGPMPKLSREPVSLIVGKTDIAGGKVRIRRMAPTVLRVARGQVVHIKHAYRLQEHSEEREEYRFLLKSSLAGKAHSPSLARLGDQWGVPEDVSGYLQHEYTCSMPGRQTITFEVGAEYCIMGWSDTEVKALDREELKGELEIVVG